MSNSGTPYNQNIADKMQHLSLPSEDMAWEDMLRRLEKEEDDRPIFFWWRGCLPWLLVGLLLLVGGTAWWWVNKEKSEKIPQTITNNNHNNANVDHAPPQTQNADIKDKNEIAVSDSKKREDHKAGMLDGYYPKPNVKKGKVSDANQKLIYPKQTKEQKQEKNKIISVGVNKDEAERENIIADKQIRETKTRFIIDSSIIIDSSREQIATNEKQKEIGITETEDSITTAKNNKPSEDNVEKKLEKKYWLSVGLTLQQLLPIAGQKGTPYNASGRKGSLADYIPAADLSLHRGNKWTAQLGFRYGAPQYAREGLTILQKQDTGFGVRTQTIGKVQKTYYHQVPLSVRYTIADRFSVGGGIVWNRFTSAIISQDLVRRNIFTQQDTFLVKDKIIAQRTADSNFVKSYYQAAVEAQYELRRFSIGAKYQFGLQPYLLFTLPGGGSSKEYNRSLIVYVRYRLWQRRK